jgi:tetratricopeptide (TPR) repeat protein
MLTYLINSLFKNKKIDESLDTTQQLFVAMQEHDSLLFNKYLFYYYNSLVINYQVSDKYKAIEVLQEAKTKTEIQQLPFYTIFIHLNLAVLNFDTQNFKEARKNLSKLKISDHYKNMDKVFNLKSLFLNYLLVLN